MSGSTAPASSARRRSLTTSPPRQGPVNHASDETEGDTDHLLFGTKPRGHVPSRGRLLATITPTPAASALLSATSSAQPPDWYASASDAERGVPAAGPSAAEQEARRAKYRRTELVLNGATQQQLMYAARKRLALEALLALGCAWAFVAVFFLPYCNALFRCGCAWPWDGGEARCNIYNDAGPRCPFCVLTGWRRHMLVSALIGCIAGLTLLVGHSVGYKVERICVWPATMLLAFLAVGFVFALIAKAATRYPYFISGPVHGRIVV